MIEWIWIILGLCLYPLTLSWAACLFIAIWWGSAWFATLALKLFATMVLFGLVATFFKKVDNKNKQDDSKGKTREA
jgi:hypothetical protein